MDEYEPLEIDLKENLFRRPIRVNASFAICDMNINPLYHDPESQTNQNFLMELQEKICDTKLNPCKYSSEKCVVIPDLEAIPDTVDQKFSVACFTQCRHSDRWLGCQYFQQCVCLEICR